jgi:hypothetical protein
MNPTVEAAWIAGSSGLAGVLVGVSGTVIVARLGFRSTRAATEAANATALATVRQQIEADRRSRIWEKQAAAYSDAIGVVRARMTLRGGIFRQMLTGAQPEQKPLLAEW